MMSTTHCPASPEASPFLPPEVINSIILLVVAESSTTEEAIRSNPDDPAIANTPSLKHTLTQLACVSRSWHAVATDYLYAEIKLVPLREEPLYSRERRRQRVNQRLRGLWYGTRLATFFLVGKQPPDISQARWVDKGSKWKDSETELVRYRKGAYSNTTLNQLARTLNGAPNLAVKVRRIQIVPENSSFQPTETLNALALIIRSCVNLQNIHGLSLTGLASTDFIMCRSELRRAERQEALKALYGAVANHKAWSELCWLQLSSPSPARRKHSVTTDFDVKSWATVYDALRDQCHLRTLYLLQMKSFQTEPLREALQGLPCLETIAFSQHYILGKSNIEKAHYWRSFLDAIPVAKLKYLILLLDWDKSKPYDIPLKEIFRCLSKPKNPNLFLERNYSEKTTTERKSCARKGKIETTGSALKGFLIDFILEPGTIRGRSPHMQIKRLGFKEGDDPVPLLHMACPNLEEFSFKNEYSLVE